jgi:hypothetical protein
MEKAPATQSADLADNENQNEMKSSTATYTGFEFEMEGYPALAIINTDLAKLENRFQYGHSVFIDLLPETFNENGHPDEAEYDYLIEVEKKLIDYLEEQTETVHVGHTTVYRKREIIFYTKEPEKVEGFIEYFLTTVEREHNFEIEPDPEWSNVAGFYELLDNES